MIFAYLTQFMFAVVLYLMYCAFLYILIGPFIEKWAPNSLKYTTV
jgi:hypothetical protein